MKLTVTQEVDVSLTPFCKNCFRLGTDKYNNRICELFGRFVYMHNGHYLKCRECYNALYDELEKRRYNNMAAVTFFIGLILGISVGFGLAALFGANDYGDYDLPDLPNDEEDKKR